MQLTKNLNRQEFACQCGCGFDTADLQLVTLIQEACDYFAKKYEVEKVSVIITSGNRCAAHNSNVGGATKSKHVMGIAADHKIKVKKDGETKTIDSGVLADYYNTRGSNKFGIGIYPNGRVHIDVRNEPARWDNRQ